MVLDEIQDPFDYVAHYPDPVIWHALEMILRAVSRKSKFGALSLVRDIS